MLEDGIALVAEIKGEGVCEEVCKNLEKEEAEV